MKKRILAILLAASMLCCNADTVYAMVPGGTRAEIGETGAPDETAAVITDETDLEVSEPVDADEGDASTGTVEPIVSDTDLQRDGTEDTLPDDGDDDENTGTAEENDGETAPLVGAMVETDTPSAFDKETGGSEEYSFGNRDIPGEKVPEATERIPEVVRFAADDIERVGNTELPSQYIPGDLPPLRDQNPYATCWSFASTALAELSLIRRGVDIGIDPIDLSELHLAWFSYNSQTDPLGGTEGDSNLLDSAQSYLDVGGNPGFAANVLSSWTGEADEDLVPYPNRGSGSYAATNGVDPALAYEDAAYLTHIYEVNPKTDRDTAKRLISENGGITISFLAQNGTSASYSASIYNSSHNCYYNPTNTWNTNHLVAAVGWDDDFPREYFNIEPPGDGAWLIRNSWTSGSYEDHQSYSGYFWMSYYEGSLYSKSYSLVFEPGDQYDNNYQYDGAMYNGGELSLGGDRKAANVFTAHAGGDGERIKAASFYTSTADVNYTIEIYTGVTDPDDPESGVLRDTITGQTSCSGYYTVACREPIPVEEDELFSVVVSLSKPGATPKLIREGDYSCVNWCMITASSQAHQSYSYNGYSWNDEGKSGRGNLRIKAFTCNGLQEDGTAEAIRLPDDLKENGLTLGIGEYRKINAIIEPATATAVKLSWSSSDPSVASVSQNGMIRGIAEGTAKITIRTADGTCSNDFTVCVDPTRLSSLYVRSSSGRTNMYKGKTEQFSISTKPYDYEPVGSVVWSSSDPTIVSIDAETGLATGIRFGQVRITATLDGKSAGMTVKCYPAAPDVTASSDERSIVTLSWPAQEGTTAYLIDRGTERIATIVPDGSETITYTDDHYQDTDTRQTIVYTVTNQEKVGNVNYNNSTEKRVEVGPGCRIVYHLGGGQNHELNPEYYRYGQNLSLFAPTPPAGYRFVDWYRDEACTQVIYSINAEPGQPVEVYAKYIGFSYRISYYGNGGEGSMPDQYLRCGNKVKLNKNLFRKPFMIFNGWNTAADGSGASYADEEEVEDLATEEGQRIVLYAQWIDTPHYTVTLDPCGGTLPGESTLSVIHGGIYYDLPIPVRPGFTFDGWYTEEDGGEQVRDNMSIKKNADHTLYAQWTGEYHTVFFDANYAGSSYSYECVYSNGETYAAFPELTRKGYTFDGWYTAPEGGDQLRVGDPICLLENQCFYAHWLADVYEVAFAVNATGATVNPAEKQVGYAGTYGEMPVPEWTGHTFTGWYTAPQGGREVTPQTIFTRGSEQTLYAHWHVDRYGVVYKAQMPDGSIPALEEGEVTYGNAYGKLPALRCAGYVFEGWFTHETDGTQIFAGTVCESTEQVTLYGHWHRAPRLVFDLNGGFFGKLHGNTGTDASHYVPDPVTFSLEGAGQDWTVNSVLSDHGITVDPAVDMPIRSKYVFDGWINEGSAVASFDIKPLATGETGDYVLIASWKPAYGKCGSPVITVIDAPAAEDGMTIPADSRIRIRAGADPLSPDAVNTGIYYTTDGSDPAGSATRMLYAGELTAVSAAKDGQVVIRAIAVREGYADSDVSEVHYPIRDETTFFGELIEKDRLYYQAEGRTAADIPAGLWIAPIDPQDCTGAAVTLSTESTVRDGVAVPAALRVYDGKKLLKAGTDYTVGYKNNKNPYSAESILLNPGKAPTVTVTGKGNYSGGFSRTFVINQVPAGGEAPILLSRTWFDGVYGNYVYNGSVQKIDPFTLYTNRDKQTALVKGTDYEVEFNPAEPVAAGTVSVTYTGKGRYTGSVKKTYRITAYDMTGDPDDRIRIYTNYNETLPSEQWAEWGQENPEFAYEKGGTRPVPAVVYVKTYAADGVTPENTIRLEAGKDYVLSWTANTAVTTPAARNLPVLTITGKGSFAGKQTRNYLIAGEKQLAGLNLSARDVVYAGKTGNYKTSFKIHDTNGTALAASDYDPKTVKYYYVEETELADGTIRNGGSEVPDGDIVPAGTVLRITVDAKNDGKSPYTGTAEGFYRVVTADLSKASVKIPNQYYTGREIRLQKSDIMVKLSGRNLSPEDYEIVSYENNTDKGTAKVTLKGLGDYGNTKTASYLINARLMNTTVRYAGNGATSGNMTDLKVTKFTGNLAVNAYKRTGYVFAGWSTRADGYLYSGWEETGDRIRSDGRDFYYVTDGTSKETVGLRTVLEQAGILQEAGTQGEHLRDGESVLITLYAVWQPVRYRVIWHMNGGKNHPLNLDLRIYSGLNGETDAACYTADTQTFFLYAPKREDWPVGYQFGGWYRDSDYKTYIEEVKQGSTGDLELWAKWIPGTYRVSFDGNGGVIDTAGTQMEDIAISYGESKVLPANRYRRGIDGGSGDYAFLGWATTKLDPAAADYEQRLAETMIFDDRSTVNDRSFGLSPADPVNGPVTLYAVWQQHFNIIWHANGGLIEADGIIHAEEKPEDEFISSYDYGTGITARAMPTPARTGFTFGGWYTDEVCRTRITQITKSAFGEMELYAKWTPYAYTISFIGNGSNGGTMKKLKLDYGQDMVLTPNAYTRKGATFAGWSTEGRAPDTPIDAEIPDTAYVTCETGVGQQAVVVIGDDEGNSIRFVLTGNNRTITLYAQWNSSPYRIRYEANGGRPAGAPVETYTYGVGKQLAVPVREGYAFLGWYKDPEFRTLVRGNTITKTESGDLTLYAKWGTAKPVIIHYDGNGAGSGTMRDQSLKYENLSALSRNTFRRQGWTFAGWSTTRQDAGTDRAPEYTDGEKVQYPDLSRAEYDGANVQWTLTLYAVWRNNYTVTYHVAQGEIGNDPVTHAEWADEAEAYLGNYDATALAAPLQLPQAVRAGYTFSGWYTEENCRTKLSAIPKRAAGDYDLYPKWTGKKYRIIFDGNKPDTEMKLTGNTAAQQRVYGEDKALPKNGYKLPGYTFLGWRMTAGQGVPDDGELLCDQQTGGLPETPGWTEGVAQYRLYAVWEREVYHITYCNIDGAIWDSEPEGSYTVDTPVNTWKMPERIGDTFRGWYTDRGLHTKSAGMKPGTTGNIVLYAKWSSNHYTICYDFNDAGDPTTVLDTSRAGYVTNYLKKGENGYVLPVATRKGFIFAGWYKEKACRTPVGPIIATPDVDMTVYAKWEKSLVPDGAYLDVSTFGAVADDAGDDTAAINAAILQASENAVDHGVNTVYIPNGVYHVTPDDANATWYTGIALRSNINLIMDYHAILTVAGTDLAEYYVMSGRLLDNVTIRGGQILGERYRHSGTAGECGHGLALVGSTNITVSETVIRDNWGDGIYLGTSYRGPESVGGEHIVIENCEISGNRRNNISIVDADDVEIRACRILDAHGTAPQCGICVEPNADASGDKINHDLTIRDTEIRAYGGRDDWRQMCFMTHSNPYKDDYVTAENIHILNCRITGWVGNYSGRNFHIDDATVIKGTRDIQMW